MYSAIRHNLGVYSRNQVYTKQEADELVKHIIQELYDKHMFKDHSVDIGKLIDRKLSMFVRKDGRVPFEGHIKGIDPKKPEHLATKAYVDSKLKDNQQDNRETVARIQALVDSVKDALDEMHDYVTLEDVQALIRRRVDARPVVVQPDPTDLKPVYASVSKAQKQLKQYIDDSINDIYSKGFVRADGSVPFKKSQKGKAAVGNDDLVPMRQVRELISDAADKLYLDIMGQVKKMLSDIPIGYEQPEETQPIEIPKDENLKIVASENYSYAGQTMEVTLCMEDMGARVEEAAFYQNSTQLYTFTKSDFYDGHITVQSAEILEDTVFVFRVRYDDGTRGQTRLDIQCRLPVFVGLLPKGRMGNNINMAYLKELEAKNGNGFVCMDKEASQLDVTYHQRYLSMARPFIALSAIYPNLKMIVVGSEVYGKEAFDVYDNVAMKVDGIDADLQYKVYVCRCALPKIQQKVIFHFEKP